MGVDLVALATSAVSLVLGVLVPGALAARALGGDFDRVERLVLAAALGRASFGAASLLALAWHRPAGCAVLPLVASVVWIASRARVRRRGSRATPAPAAGAEGSDAPRHGDLPVAAIASIALLAIALVIAVVGRSARIDEAGDLVFFGTDAARDPLFYVATATQLRDHGLPLQNAYTAGFPIVGHYLFYAAFAGMRELAEMLGGGARVALELVFRVLPVFDVATLGLAALALARRLGASAAGATIAAAAVLLAGDAAWIVNGALSLAGVEHRDVLAWAAFGPFLLPVNPITPALHGLFAAALLLAAARPERAALPGAVAAGALVGALAELKLFLFAPAIAALVATALLRPPAALARFVRVAALACAVVATPSIVEKIVFARGEGARFDVGFRACPGCLPRHFLDVAYGSFDPSFAIFERFALADLASPASAALALLASLAFLVLALGGRLAGVVWLARAARDVREPGRALATRMLALASLAGAALTVVASAAPHHLNAAQFLWSACFGLAIAFGVGCGRWIETRRPIVLLATAAALVITLGGGVRIVLRQGVEAPVGLRVSAGERALLDEIASRTPLDDVVLEPSWLLDADRPSLVPSLAGRRVVITTSSAAAYLPSWERLFRLQNVERVFTSRDADAVSRAIEATGARLVLAPAGSPMQATAVPGLATIAQNEAGSLLRVETPPAPRR